MKKSELIESVAATSGLDKKQAEAALGAFVGSVMAKTKSGEQVSIFGFGTFKPTARKARMGRNPQTGTAVKIAASKGVKFQPATAFKTTLNTRGTKKAAAPAKSTAATKSAATTAKKSVAPAKKTTAAKKATAPAKKAPATVKSAPVVKKAAVAAKKVVTPAKKAVKSTKKR